MNREENAKLQELVLKCHEELILTRNSMVADKMTKTLKSLYLAWTKEGISPDYHKKQMELLKRNWYPLYKAMVAFIKDYETNLSKKQND